jgi:hypothetical protein
LEPRHRDQAWLSFLKLIDSIETWTERWDENPKPFIWHKTAEEIIARFQRGRAAPDRVTESATDH